MTRPLDAMMKAAAIGAQAAEPRLVVPFLKQGHLQTMRGQRSQTRCTGELPPWRRISRARRTKSKL